MKEFQGLPLNTEIPLSEWINDCNAGKIDLIVTKSVSRFARNILDCIGYVRRLKQLNPPIGIFFETENIYTLDPNSEMSLSFIATLAQEESHTKSEIMNASIEMRFKRGIFLTPTLLGYDHDEDGNLIINEEEAKIVRLIFFMYLYGYTCQRLPILSQNSDARPKREIPYGQREAYSVYCRMNVTAEMSLQEKHSHQIIWTINQKRTVRTETSMSGKIIMNPLSPVGISLRYRG